MEGPQGSRNAPAHHVGKGIGLREHGPKGRLKVALGSFIRKGRSPVREHHETVEAFRAARRVHPGLMNGEVLLIKDGRRGGKQVGLVMGKDEDLRGAFMGPTGLGIGSYPYQGAVGFEVMAKRRL